MLLYIDHNDGLESNTRHSNKFLSLYVFPFTIDLTVIFLFLYANNNLLTTNPIKNLHFLAEYLSFIPLSIIATPKSSGLISYVIKSAESTILIKSISVLVNISL